MVTIENFKNFFKNTDIDTMVSDKNIKMTYKLLENDNETIIRTINFDRISFDDEKDKLYLKSEDGKLCVDCEELPEMVMDEVLDIVCDLELCKELYSFTSFENWLRKTLKKYNITSDWNECVKAGKKADISKIMIDGSVIRIYEAMESNCKNVILVKYPNIEEMRKCSAMRFRILKKYHEENNSEKYLEALEWFNNGGYCPIPINIITEYWGYERNKIAVPITGYKKLILF